MSNGQDKNKNKKKQKRDEMKMRAVVINTVQFQVKLVFL